MVNKVILIGNLGGDPEIRSTQEGKLVANWSMATNRGWKDEQGNRQEETEWHNVVAFGPRAKAASDYLRQGRRVYIEGRLKTSFWDGDGCGKRHYRAEVVVEDMQFLGGAPERREEDDDIAF